MSFGDILFISLAVLGSLVLLVVLVRLKPGLNREAYREKWDKINQKDLALRVIEADKLLDLALIESGYKGQTMAKRLKKAQTHLKKPQSVWAAHRLRNQIAHEADFSLKKTEVKRALNSFKQALKDLGAL